MKKTLEVDFLLSYLYPRLASQTPVSWKQAVWYESARDILSFWYRRRCLASVISSSDDLLKARAS